MKPSKIWFRINKMWSFQDLKKKISNTKTLQCKYGLEKGGIHVIRVIITYYKGF